MRIGIDLGGTKTEIIALAANGETRYRQRVASVQGSYTATISQIKSLVDTAESYLACRASVGMGIPGSICQYQHSVKNANSHWLNGRPLGKDLALALGRTIKIENDANCFVLSEAVDGAAANYNNVFGVIIGTGCGAGIVINQKLVTGANGLGGEWGHNPLPFPQVFTGSSSFPVDVQTDFFDRFGRPDVSTIYQHKPSICYQAIDQAHTEYPGPLCYCGKRGCLETWISGTGFAKDYQRVTGVAMTAEQIAKAAEQGDSHALDTLDRYCERLAKSLAQVINILDPDVIVLGGGMSNIDALYQDVPQRWGRYIFSDQSNTVLLKAQHGDASGVRGAAFL
jgi:predicted NBD/HSP70 family sugar kinase